MRFQLAHSRHQILSNVLKFELDLLADLPLQIHAFQLVHPFRLCSPHEFINRLGD